MLSRQILLLFFCVSLCCVSSVARGDGGAVVFSGESGPLRVTMFVEPVPPRVGLIDLSLLVQDRTSLEAIEAYTAFVTLTRADSATVEEHEASMSRNEATNRLFQAATVEIPTTGSWQVKLHVDWDRSEYLFQFPLEIQAPPARFWDVLIWILLPAIPLLLFVAGRLRRIVANFND